ncbi:biosynthetic-type acetolactate synthase large subunit [Muribaculaceae bacterium Isolate-039 (Harlan)]|jgi:acetolactate synthase-1/2/3 large subunit|nr:MULTISPECIES: biosynthetic-type acetolactate synthase large subunit [Duncaniella]NBH91697.1 biosynthetic-type acetolactate synthase large subunit [Muribaculaceae bacterium S4]NBI20109.1 biosynthetic-type acetolactate synthase large subunit [Muribaculaceae bacterium Z1]ROS91292.1 biosynthetic-type acetolactate synthase large subunit [Muribaculaceae bacterium Isolate-039 (Harlan)]ROS95599.1 biosynthetic-type acetolactate synthase large subunit [Muribaculaceae bacterium Isolate-077 (Janvier)]R
MSERITGAEAICRALLAEGVDTIFGYPGGQIMPFYDKLYDFTDSLRHILTRHEQGAVHAAQGYARASGRVGVVTVTSGPAATNVITGLGDANIDCTPIVVITGQVGVASLGTDAFQETDVIGITQPITKWAYQIRRPEEIPWAMARAFYIATTGRPGAVVLDITRDAQVGTLDWSYKKTNYIRSYNPAPELQPGEIISAAALINRSERPLILSGHGVMLSEAETDLLALAEKADIPVATTLLGLSTIPSEHPLNKGMVGMHGNIGPNIATNNADVILAVGMRFDDRVTGVIKSYAPQAKIIHIDIDSAEFNKNVKAHIAIHADAKTALRALLPQINKADRKEWLTTFERPENVEQAEVIERETDPKDLGPESPMRMGEVVRKLSEATGNKAIVVTDVGQNQMMSARYSSYTMPKSMITSGGLGTMGFCLPAAIGAKLAEPSREVLAFMGDGGFQMTMQELGTILEYRIGVKMVLLNNNYLGNVRQWQAMFYNNRFSATPMVNPDFVAIAAAYGIPAENVSCRAELDSAIARMAAHDGAYLLNVNIDPTDMVFPMVTPGSAIDNILINATDKYEA